MEDNFTLDRLLRATVISSAFTVPIISILLMTGLKTENKVLLTIGTVIITMLGVAFLISDIVIIIEEVKFRRFCKKNPKKEN